MPALTEAERRHRIRMKVAEVSQVIARLSAIIGEFNDLGVDAAFRYTAAKDGYGGDLEFMHEIQDKIVHVEDENAAQADAHALLGQALEGHEAKH